MTTSLAEDRAHVFVVDDDPGILSAFSRLLGTAGYEVRTFSSSREFLICHDPALLGCALLDIRMSELDGLSVQTALSRQGIARPVIFITACDDARTGVQAMKAGAIDYLVKPVDSTALLSTVQTAIEVDRRARNSREEVSAIEDRYACLTPREREVMQHVIEGRLNKQIAYDLGIVEKTVKVHRARVMQKMGTASLAVLVHLAERLAIVKTGRLMRH